MAKRLSIVAAVALLLALAAFFVWTAEGIDCPRGECPLAGEVAGLALLPLLIVAVGAAIATLVARRRG